MVQRAESVNTEFVAYMCLVPASTGADCTTVMFFSREETMCAKLSEATCSVVVLRFTEWVFVDKIGTEHCEGCENTPNEKQTTSQSKSCSILVSE